jgi:hypothetical protein
VTGLPLLLAHWEILRQNSSGHVGNIICSEIFTNFGDFTQQTPGLLADSTGERGNATSGFQDPTKTRFFCMYTCSLRIVDSHNRRIMLRMANFWGPLARFCEPFPNCWVISGALHWLTSLKPSEH